MKIDAEIRHKIKESVDLVDIMLERGISLKHTGATYKALCPFHSEKTPSFNVNPQRGFFHCFGCGKGGDVIEFIMLYDRLSFVEAVKELAKRAGITLEFQTEKASSFQERGLQCLQKAAQLYHSQLMEHPGSQVARSYLESRSISKELWKQFQLGFAFDDWQGILNYLQSQHFQVNEMLKTGLIKSSDRSNRHYDTFRSRVMFPIRDTRGRCIGFGGRVIRKEDMPKYLNSPETEYYQKSRVLYGLYEGMDIIRQKKNLIFVEGYLDVIRLHESGFQQAVATCGTALTPEHIHLIQRYADSVTLLFDGDQAGRNAALKNCRLFLPHTLDVKIVTLPEDEDPDTFLLKYGTETFDNLLKQGKPALQFLVNQTLDKYPQNMQGRTKALEELLPAINEIRREDRRQFMIADLAHAIRLPENVVIKRLNSLRSSNKNATLKNLQDSGNQKQEDRDEKWILQILLTNRALFHIAREFLQAAEFVTPHFRQIYTGLLNITEEDFQSISIEAFEERFPDIYPDLIKIYMEEFVGENAESQLRYSIKRVKERSLKQQFQERLATASEKERLQAIVELRKLQADLDHIYQQR